MGDSARMSVSFLTGNRADRILAARIAHLCVRPAPSALTGDNTTMQPGQSELNELERAVLSRLAEFDETLRCRWKRLPVLSREDTYTYGDEQWDGTIGGFQIQEIP